MQRGPLGLKPDKSEGQRPNATLERGTLSNRRTDNPRKYVKIEESPDARYNVLEFKLEFPPKDAQISCDAFKWILLPDVKITSVEMLGMQSSEVFFTTFYQVEGEIAWEVEYDLVSGGSVKKDYAIEFKLAVPITKAYLEMVLPGRIKSIFKLAAMQSKIRKLKGFEKIIKFIWNNWSEICRNTGELSKLLDESKIEIRFELRPPVYVDPNIV